MEVAVWSAVTQPPLSTSVMRGTFESGGPAAAVETDVAIVGAGPAGSTLATLLARRGVSVALIERDEFPRDKLCGEFLSYDAMPILDAIGATPAIDAHGAPPITNCRIVARHRACAFDFPHAARGVSRLFLDDLLTRTAIAAGATLLTATATGLARDGVRTNAGDVHARVVAGGWGRWGRFDTQLHRGFVTDKTHRNFGFKRHYRGGVPSSTIELYSFRRGYLGVSAIEDGLTNICGLVHADRIAHLKGRWDAFIDMIRGEEPPLERMYACFEPAQPRFLSSEPVIFRSRSAVEGGVFMVGDASGVIDPLTGNGMAMAIQSALVAAPFILDKLAGRDVENAYRQRHHELFGKRIHWSRRAAYVLSRPALLDAGLACVRGDGIGRMLLRRTRADRDIIARLCDEYSRRR